ncbi:hypothetical protein LRR81_08340 [Metabacillus sp. GX 13764]|uniref:hypothetical protein n=1 Tax=Metabacillus kandeliae TaxID=2900151 RepID=UPI001E5701C9|nr:hypothetical protein [Metabacillus kandeliae]MCD7034241.1 hypothetical protein [Metabacillus kandeliae]
MNLEKSSRYEILLQAIEVFTQRYESAALFDFAFSFANELLNPAGSALFKRVNDEFILLKTQNGMMHDYRIPVTEKLEKLPLFYGRPLSEEQLPDYFSPDFIRDFSAVHVIPLINDTVLAGFIVTAGLAEGELTEGDRIVSTMMMSLVNASLENNQRLHDFQSVTAELDRKIFSLFVLNQSTKALLSERNAEHLCEMATDVFSEISGSRVTSFGLYDALTNKLKIKGYRNVHSFQKKYAELSIGEVQCCGVKTVIRVKEEQELVQQLIQNTEVLTELEAEYIILIKKEELIGMVFLSDSRQASSYDSGTIELIETLASSTYIALSNARHFETLQKQKLEAEAKLDVMHLYNRLIRTINSCRTTEEILKLSLKTLELGFGIKKAFFAFYNGEAYETAASIGVSLEKERFLFDEDTNSLINDEVYYDYFAGRLPAYFTNESLCGKLGESSCVVIAPIQGHSGYVPPDEVQPPYGYLIVTETAENLKDEEILLIDTITRNITPLIYHLDQKEMLPKLEIR